MKNKRLEEITIECMKEARANEDFNNGSIIIYSLGCHKYEFHINQNNIFNLYRTWRECSE
jgi:hypothetical protein